MNEKLAELRRRAMALPLTPGVYIMKDKQGKIIYIGKAKQLKNRVSQYFAKSANHTPKVAGMVENVDRFDYILCDSEFEALVLECSLIKQHAPKYNILLKDDKGYHYIKISGDEWPRISAVHQKTDDGSKYIGPYISSYIVTQTVDQLNKLFGLPTCSRVFPRDIGKGRACLNSYIGNCSAPCTGRVSHKSYIKQIDDALEFLKGGSGEYIKTATAQMEEAAEQLNFERAAILRDRIRAVRQISQRQKVVSSRVARQDVIALAKADGSTCFEVFRFDNGMLVDDLHFIIDQVDDTPALRSEFILGYYTARDDIPPQVTIDGDTDDDELIAEWLSHRAGRTVHLAKPQKGEQARLAEMCRNNAAEHLAAKMGRVGSETKALSELANLLGLRNPPERIESYDISNLAGSENVAGMVVFKGGRPCKRDYRKFKIKGFDGQDDCASMREVLTRRLTEYADGKARGETEGFAELPDLILLDGGIMQVNAVAPIIAGMGLSIPLYGMVKDDKHRTRALVSQQGEIAISSLRSVFTLVSTIQEEVHRFAISYHRAGRSKSMINSSLTNIQGVGKARAAKLLKRFKTVSAISRAEADELAAVDGIDKRTAQNIYNYYHQGENNG